MSDDPAVPPLRRNWFHVLLALAVLASLAASPHPEPTAPGASSASTLKRNTILSGVVRDPVTDAWEAAPATVRMVNRSVTSDDSGAFEVGHRRRRGKALSTEFTADGYLPYRTWTLPGTETERRIYLFPERQLQIQDEGLVDGGMERANLETLRFHFNEVYQYDFAGTGQPQSEPLRGLRRWMEQPEIVIFNNIIESRIVDGEHATVASGRKIGPRVRRRLKQAVRRGIGPLTGGFLSADTLRVRRMEEGEVIGSGFEETIPPGEIRLYVTDDNPGSGAGGVWLDGHTIVGGALWLSVDVMRKSRSDYGPGGVLHELGHTVGMDHPFGVDALCSVVSSFKCYEISDESWIPPFDYVIGRLAYSRLPGNDGEDTDPPPAPTERVRAGPTTLHLFDGARLPKPTSAPGTDHPDHSGHSGGKGDQ